MTPLGLAAGEPSGRGLDHLEFGDGCIAQLVNLGKPRPWRRNHFAERSEPRDERLRQRFDVPAGQRAKQHKLEKLVIAEPIAAGLTKTRAQTLAMAVIMWWRLRDARLATATIFLHDRPAAAPDPFLSSGADLAEGANQPSYEGGAVPREAR